MAEGLLEAPTAQCTNTVPFYFIELCIKSAI